MAFVCIKKACRSRVADALARSLAHDIIDPLSGRLESAEEVDPGAVETIKKIGADLSRAHPKQLSGDTLASSSLVVHIGCEAQGVCLTVPEIPSEDWGIEDPAGKSTEKYRKMVRMIKEKALDLAARLRSGRLPSHSVKTTYG